MMRADLKASIDEALRETGGSMARSSVEVVRYSEDRALDLARAQAAGEPGLDLARRAALDATIAFAAIAATDQADKLDARLRGLLELGQRVLSNALAAALGVPPVPA